MDFFAHQDQARNNTRLLIGLYIGCVVLIVLAVLFLIVIFFPNVLTDSQATTRSHHVFSEQWFTALWHQTDWRATLVVSSLVVGGIMLASIFKTSALSSGGGRKIATSLGGRRLDPGSQDHKERQLQNIVEEIALASGIAVPEVYILDQDQTINAFAAGSAINEAIIGVTRGTLENLSRDELQGVIAHEFSHIVHGDMKLNIRLIGVLFGILCLQQFGYILLRSGGRGRRRNQGAGAILMLGLGLMVLGVIGYFFGSLLKAAVSRQREFLADAAAVQYTRNPGGIAGALKKIGNFGSFVSNEHATEISHMFFAKGTRGFFANAFATHPPLRTRIQRIDASFQATEKTTQSPSSMARKKSEGLAGFAQAGGQTPVAKQAVSKILNQVGTTSPAGISSARSFLEKLPKNLFAAIHDPTGAQATIFAILLSDIPAEQAKQINAITADPGLSSSATLTHSVGSLHESIKLMGLDARLPLLELCVPALKTLDRDTLNRCLATAKQIILADEKIEIFEYALFTVLRYNVLARHELRQSAKTSHSFPEATSIVLAALAHLGPQDKEEISRAFARGTAKLSMDPTQSMPSWTINTFDSALRKLDDLSYRHKQSLLAACGAVVAHDGLISSCESEVLRAIAETLGCPLPISTL